MFDNKAILQTEENKVRTAARHLWVVLPISVGQFSLDVHRNYHKTFGPIDAPLIEIGP
jgi:hypothetical protein